MKIEHKWANELKELENIFNDFQSEIDLLLKNSVLSYKEDLRKVYQLHRKKSRFVYERYLKGIYSYKFMEYLIHKEMVDEKMIVLWQKKETENLCCETCLIKSKQSCVCRTFGKFNSLKECRNCGCKGCN
ncbi:hypothetical protein NUSPORA_00353 [Nucleospora cyclopteri]